MCFIKTNCWKNENEIKIHVQACVVIKSFPEVFRDKSVSLHSAFKNHLKACFLFWFSLIDCYKGFCLHFSLTTLTKITFLNSSKKFIDLVFFLDICCGTGHPDILNIFFFCQNCFFVKSTRPFSENCFCFNLQGDWQWLIQNHLLITSIQKHRINWNGCHVFTDIRTFWYM